jgi:outer membrane biosynthesis protein TonB
MERDWDDISEIKRRKEEKKEEKKPETQETEVPEQEIEPEETEPKARETTVATRETKLKTQDTERKTVSGPSAVLEEMKAAGITGAIVRADGILVHSTMPLSDSGAGLVASVSNVTDALMKKADDAPKEIEVSFQNQILVIIPIEGYLFVGMVKDREQKKAVRDFAAKARAAL